MNLSLLSKCIPCRPTNFGLSRLSSMTLSKFPLQQQMIRRLSFKIMKHNESHLLVKQPRLLSIESQCFKCYDSSEVAKLIGASMPEKTKIDSHQVIDMTDIGKLIKNPNYTMKVRPLLLSFTGLPESGKIEALRNFLRNYVEVSDDPITNTWKVEVGSGIMHHFELLCDSESIKTHFKLHEASKSSLVASGIFFALKQICDKTNKLPILGTVIDNQSDFEQYLPQLAESLQKAIPKNTDSTEKCEKFAKELKELVPHSLSLINIWNYSINSTVFRHILSALQGDINNHDMLLFFEFERDINNFDKPLQTSNDSCKIPRFTDWRPRLHYLLRLCWYSHGHSKTKNRNCHVVAAFNKVLDKTAVKEKLHTLEEDLRPIAQHVQIEKLLDFHVQAINVMDDQKHLYQKIQEIASKVKEQEIPLSWGFLRTILNFSRKQIILRSELEKVAKVWEIDLHRFLKFFTSFGSILDLSIADNATIKQVIIKPAEFVQSINDFLCPSEDSLRNFPTIKFGIVPEKYFEHIFGAEDWPNYMEAMVSIALAMPIEISNMQVPVSSKIDENEKYYYIPLACTGDYIKEPDPESLHLFTNINTPHHFKQVSFVKSLLDSCPDFRLTFHDVPNQVVLKDTASNNKITLVWQNPVIRMNLRNPSVKIASHIIRTFNETAKDSKKVTRFKMLVSDAKGKVDTISSLLSDYHILPDDAYCASHQNNELINWNEALKLNPIPIKSVPLGDVKEKELSSLIKKMIEFDENNNLHPQFLANHFGLNYTDNGETREEQLENIFWKWITSQRKYERRRKLAQGLHELSHRILLVFEDEKLAKELKELSQKVDLYYIPVTIKETGLTALAGSLLFLVTIVSSIIALYLLGFTNDHSSPDEQMDALLPVLPQAKEMGHINSAQTIMVNCLPLTNDVMTQPNDNLSDFRYIPDPPPVPDDDCPRKKDIKTFNQPFQHKLVEDVNVVLMTVTDDEYCSVIGKTKPLQPMDRYVTEVTTNGITFFLGYYGQYKVAIVQMPPGHDYDTYRILPKLQDIVKAKYYIVVGMCYGLNEAKTKYGDVLVSKVIHDITKEHTLPRRTVFEDNQYKVPSSLLSVFDTPSTAGFSMKRYEDDYVNVKAGGIISKSTVVKSTELRSRIKNQFPKALGGEMEGSYVVQALCNTTPTPEIIVIKGIADWADERKEESRKWQKFAANAASKYVLYRMEKSDALKVNIDKCDV